MFSIYNLVTYQVKQEDVILDIQIILYHFRCEFFLVATIINS